MSRLNFAVDKKHKSFNIISFRSLSRAHTPWDDCRQDTCHTVLFKALYLFLYGSNVKNYVHLIQVVYIFQLQVTVNEYRPQMLFSCVFGIIRIRIGPKKNISVDPYHVVAAQVSSVVFPGLLDHSSLSALFLVRPNPQAQVTWLGRPIFSHPFRIADLLEEGDWIAALGSRIPVAL